MTDREIYDVFGTPYPPYVVTEAQRARWNASLRAAESVTGESVGSAFHWQTTRWLYHSDIPTE